MIWTCIGIIVSTFCGCVFEEKAVSVIDVFKNSISGIFKYGSVSGNSPLWFLLSLFFTRILVNIGVKIRIHIAIIAILGFTSAYLLFVYGVKVSLLLGSVFIRSFFLCMRCVYEGHYA